VVTAFVDSVVLIDLLRSYPPAISWLGAQPKLAITPAVWLEVLYGAPNAEARDRALKLLRRFERVDLLPSDFDWAIEQTLRFRLSHSVDPMDCLIASVAFRLKKPLYTQNLKHFSPMLGPLVRKPY
jgi:predicted nucleic acid-binding protein